MDEATPDREARSPLREALAPGPFEDRFDEIVAASLETAAAAGTLFFVLFTAIQPLYFDPPLLYPLAALGAATVLAFATIWWTTRQGSIPDELAQPVLTVGLALLLLNALSVSTVSGSPITTVWFALVAIAAGLLLLSREWLAVVLAADVVGWLVVLVVSPPHPGWTGYAGFVLLASLVLAGVAVTTRRRVYSDLLAREHKLVETNAELDRARREAQAAEKLQSRFLANVSHDVRTPASAIVAEARELRTSELDPEQRESLDAIEDSARHLVRLLDDVLDISEIEAGGLSIEEEAFELDRVLTASLGMVANLAEDEPIEIERHVDDDVPPFLRSDPHRLQQILGNLLSNAVKFTEEGRVELRVQVEDTDPLTLRFEVADTGIGIPEDRTRELFRPFLRLEQTPEAEGTGLGLAICKRLVEQFDGEIGVESEPGRGSVFWFTLPVEEADPDDIDPTRQPVSLHGKTAWIVGADGALSTTLERWGFQVERMPGIGFVEEAREEERQPDLLVLDLVTIQAPEAFLAERLRAWRQAGIPVLVLTADGQLPDALEGIEGPGTHAATSTNEDELRRAVEAMQPAEQARPQEVELDEGMAARHPLAILVVEDSPGNRRLLEATLGRLGYEPESLGRGDEAIERLTEEPLDLVFLDLQLPGADGDTVLRHAHEEIDEDRRPRIVVVTGHTDPETVERIQDAGADAYLSKPVAIREIVDELEATPARATEGGAASETEADRADEGEGEG